MQCRPQQTLAPRTLDELQQTVARISAAGGRLRVAGSGHSFVPLVETDATLLTLAGVMSASTANVMQGTGIARAQSMVVMIAWAMLFGALADGSYAWITTGPPVVEKTGVYLGGILYLGIIASAVTFPLYFNVIRAVGPGQAAWSSVLIPIIAMGFSTVFEGYRWAPLSIAGGVVALVGLVIAVAKRPQRPSVSGNMVSVPVDAD